jgi:hypothetical protein
MDDEFEDKEFLFYKTMKVLCMMAGDINKVTDIYYLKQGTSLRKLIWKSQLGSNSTDNVRERQGVRLALKLYRV